MLFDQENGYQREAIDNGNTFYLKRNGEYLKNEAGEKLEFTKEAHYDEDTDTFVAYSVEGYAILVTNEGVFDHYDIPYKELNRVLRRLSGNDDRKVCCKFAEIGACGDDEEHSRPVLLAEQKGRWCYCSYSRDGGFKMEDHVYDFSNNIGNAEMRLGRRLGELVYANFHCIEYRSPDSSYLKIGGFNGNVDKYFDNYKLTDAKGYGWYILGSKVQGGQVVFTEVLDGAKKSLDFLEFWKLKGSWALGKNKFFWGLYEGYWAVYRTCPLPVNMNDGVSWPARFGEYHEGESFAYDDEKHVFVKRNAEGIIIAVYIVVDSSNVESCRDSYINFVEILRGKTLSDEGLGDLVKTWWVEWHELREESIKLKRDLGKDDRKLLTQIKSVGEAEGSSVQSSLPTPKHRIVDWSGWTVRYFNDCECSKTVVTEYSRAFYVYSTNRIQNFDVVMAKKDNSILVGQQLKYLGAYNRIYCRLLFELTNVPDNVFEFLRGKCNVMFKMTDIIKKIGEMRAKEEAEKAADELKKNVVTEKIEEKSAKIEKEQKVVKLENTVDSTAMEFQVPTTIVRRADNDHLALIEEIKGKTETLMQKRYTVSFKVGNAYLSYQMKQFALCPDGFNPFERRSYVRKDTGVFVLLDDRFGIHPGTENGKLFTYEIPGEGKDGQFIRPDNANGAIIEGRPVYLFYKDNGGRLCFLDCVTCFSYKTTGQMGNTRLSLFLR